MSEEYFDKHKYLLDEDTIMKHYCSIIDRKRRDKTPGSITPDADYEEYCREEMIQELRSNLIYREDTKEDRFRYGFKPLISSNPEHEFVDVVPAIEDKKTGKLYCSHHLREICKLLNELDKE